MTFKLQETKVVKIGIIGCHNLCKKDIFGASDPYVKISLIKNQDNTPVDSAYTKTKKRVIYFYLFYFDQISIRFCNFFTFSIIIIVLFIIFC